MEDYLLPAHLTILALTLVGILFADHEGFAWIRGKKETLSWSKIFPLHLWVGFGLIGMLITGGLILATAKLPVI